MTNWSDLFEQEISHAEQARAGGNEGMARVCARRAAGAVVEEYLNRQGIERQSNSAYDHLRLLAALPGLEAEALEAAGHLLMRLTPEHTLPVEADLLAEARRLRQLLLQE